MDGAEIVRALASASGAVLRETHASWVVLAGDRALKIKKPVSWSFLDYGTLEARRVACRKEVQINAALAPGVYLGVRPILVVDGAPVVGAPGDNPAAVEYAVDMRRFDEADTMAGRLATIRLTRCDVDVVAERLARFHGGVDGCDLVDAPAVFGERITADLDDLDALGFATADEREFAGGLLAREGDAIRARAEAGLVRNGHGDLRAEHVVLGAPLAIVDRIEFDPKLRCTDVADDLAFLAMDLESLGARWAANELVTAYAAAGGHTAPKALAAGYGWHRALVRAKVALLRNDHEEARALFVLADRLAWRARASGAIVVCGPPASGKSTLASALSKRLELPVVSSDLVRKELLGVPATQRAGQAAYSASVTERVYAELLTRAQALHDANGGVIIDATFGRHTDRARLAAALGAAVRWIWCDPPEIVLRFRAIRRLGDTRRVSDAGPDIAATLAAAYEPLDEVPTAALLHLRAQWPVEMACANVAHWIDTRR